MKDLLGNRMKDYEAATDVRLITHLPIYARIDGRTFSKFTKGMTRPFDPIMSTAMINTVKGLVEKTHACIGYTQSDEISLVFQAMEENSDIIFGGRILKLTSVLASLATALFSKEMAQTPYINRLPHFDARVCSLPTQTEAANMLVWRYKDARKNAISMAAQSGFSTKELHGKNGLELIEMLWNQKGIDFESHYPSFFKNGTFVKRVTKLIAPDDLVGIPQEFMPLESIARSSVEEVPCNDFLSVQNREEFIFG